MQDFVRTAVCVISTLVPLSYLQAAAFKAEGKLSFVNSDRPSVTNTRSFSVMISQCQSSIRVFPAAGDKGISYFEYISDGTNSSFFTQFSAKPKTGPLSKRSTDSSIAVRPQNYPHPTHNMIVPVWLAFGSGCYFAEQVGGSINCLHMFLDPKIGRYASAIKLRASWQRSDSEPFLLSQMIDFLDGQIQYSEGPSTSRMLQLPPEYLTGETNSFYAVNRWSLTNGFSIPLEFVFAQYSRLSHRVQPVINQVLGKTESFEILREAPRFNPKIEDGQATRVLDYTVSEELRDLFRGSPAVYTSTNRSLLNAEQIALRESERRNKRLKEGPQPTAAGSTYYVFGVILALVLSLPAYFVVHKWKHDKATRNQTKRTTYGSKPEPH